MSTLKGKRHPYCVTTLDRAWEVQLVKSLPHEHEDLRLNSGTLVNTGDTVETGGSLGLTGIQFSQSSEFQTATPPHPRHHKIRWKKTEDVTWC